MKNLNLKNISLLVILTIGAISCKNVDKNPTGCDYDSTEIESGHCVPNSIIVTKYIAKNKKKYINDPFILKNFTYDGYYSKYEAKISLLEDEINSNDTMIKNYLALHTVSESYIGQLTDDISTGEALYARVYSTEIYENNVKLRSLREEITKLTNYQYKKTDLLNLMDSDNRINEIEIADKLIARINRLALNVVEQSNETAPLKMITISLESEIAILSSLSYNIHFTNIRKNLALQEGCSAPDNTCLNDLRLDIEENLPTLYVLGLFYDL